ncbi:(R,R)-butanediol dehydrogenase / diacetyl reductase [Rhizoctonia solani AG-1 IB]|uniref:(R,R)-butanediol dehydrogenase / diacetyl reductase n=1 Tax=Thanatephorus cucumeris (strain AG1-IB / isolate 7/3/14) TaxID=1108050 RepID=M5BTE1_THACB|nr:(R,R)-butanediol dehydrogenase / diacetyl reductase [Rhizoctonia solani AG-1 IB]
MPGEYKFSSNSQVAIVTGAAQGLGKAIAIKLASEGYSIVISDLPTKQESLTSTLQDIKDIHKSHPQSGSLSVLHIECDVTDEAQVDSLVNTTVTQFGRLNVMVANAGIIKSAPLLDTTTDMIDSIHAVNVKGLFYCYRAAARAMMASGGGRIIGACSVAGKLPIPYLGAYVMSKHAVRGLTHTAAQEWGAHGITVNAYAPGMIDTNMSSHEYAPGFEQKALDIIATHKKSTPEHVAGIVAFLVSPSAANINGQCISVDGGWNFD